MDLGFLGSSLCVRIGFPEVKLRFLPIYCVGPGLRWSGRYLKEISLFWVMRSSLEDRILFDSRSSRFRL